MSNTASSCAGRFSLQLPSPFEHGIRPNIFNGVQLSWEDLQGENLDRHWQKHVDELQTEQGHTTQGARVLKNYLLDGRRAVFYRYAPTADSSHTLETWTPYGNRILKSEFDGSKAYLADMESATVNVLRHFVPSTSEGVPSPGSGFCIQGGTIQLPPQDGEQMTGGWNLTMNYELSLDSAVVSRPYDVMLIEEARKAISQSAITPGSHLTVTRAAHRTVLGMEGQERIAHYHNDPDPTNFYNADFIFGGTVDKGSRPGWHLHLNAYDRDGQKVDEAAFIATWDEILRNMTMRLHD